MDAAATFRDNGLMLSCRFVLDSSQQKRGQATAFDVAELFGRENVRTTRSHAKFVTVTNDDGWRVAITSSMNLNLNQRVEQFMMVDDPGTCGMFLGFVDELFLSEPFSVEDRTLPALPGLEGESALGIEATNWRKIARGRFPKIGRFE